MAEERSLPALLREAERRVNRHVWGDRRAIVSIPARRDEDVDLLLMEAAEEIERLRERERILLDSHTGCGCDPTCKVCVEKGYT